MSADPRCAVCNHRVIVTPDGRTEHADPNDWTLADHDATTDPKEPQP